jgi:hypothetical protein
LTPTTVDSGNSERDLELGVMFQSSVSGQITALRFYKSAANTGTHIGTVWSAAGALLGSVTFTNETASGWQEQPLASIAINANTVYTASYHLQVGHWSYSGQYFSTPYVNGSLSSPVGAGLYTRTGPPYFPHINFINSNFLIDFRFVPVGSQAGACNSSLPFTALASQNGYKYEAVFTNASGSATSSAATLTVNGPPIVTSPSNQQVATGSNVTLTSTATGTPSPTVQWQTNSGGATWTNLANVTPYSGVTTTTLTITGATLAQNGFGYRAVFTNSCATVNSSAATLTVTASKAYDLAVADASNHTTNVRALQGATLSGSEYVFTSPFGATTSSPAGISQACFYLDPSGPLSTYHTLFASSLTPATIDNGSSDPGGLDLGVEFTSSVAGTVTAIRFYKAAANTGTHIGTIWSTSGATAGTSLGSVTFTNETSSGWQEQQLLVPVPIAANSTYIVSYHENVGHWSKTSPFFDTAYSSSPLTAPINAGVYAYGGGASPIYPNPSSAFDTNYWVDAKFLPTGSTPVTCDSATPYDYAATGWLGTNGGHTITELITKTDNSTETDSATFTITNTTHSVDLAWVAGTHTNPVTYTVFRAAGACSGSSAFASIYSGVATTSKTDSPVTSGASYCYAVKAIDSVTAVPSTFSNSVTAVVP